MPLTARDRKLNAVIEMNPDAATLAASSTRLAAATGRCSAFRY